MRSWSASGSTGESTGRRAARGLAPLTAGFTLLEVIVALGVFVMLGLLLAGALHSAITSWHRGEGRREVYERARAVLDQVGRDVAATFTHGGRVSDGGPVHVIFLADRDPKGRQRLRFVRTLSGEDADPWTAGSGAGLESEGHDEYMTRGAGAPSAPAGSVPGAGGTPPAISRAPAGKGGTARAGGGAGSGKLRPLEGLSEVAWLRGLEDGSAVLYRAERSPIGGSESLLEPDSFATGAAIARRALPVSGEILHLGLLFWSQYTTTWDASVKPTTDLAGGGGPLLAWDSTRGILPGPPARHGQPDPAGGSFFLARGAASRDDPVDDVTPALVRVTIVVGGTGPTDMSTVLAKDVSASETDIVVMDATRFPEDDAPGLERFIKVGEEWMRYGRRGTTRFTIESGGRGLRGTRAERHSEGDVVRAGLTFTRTYAVPARRGYYNQ